MKPGNPGPKDLVNPSQLDLPTKHRSSTINLEVALNEKSSDYKLLVSNTASKKIQALSVRLRSLTTQVQHRMP